LSKYSTNALKYLLLEIVSASIQQFLPVMVEDLNQRQFNAASGSPTVVEGKPECITVVEPQFFALGVDLNHSTVIQF
jgi:hypothetical protein